MAKKTVVLAYFPNEIAADDAVESLKQWDKADDDVKLNAIGVLVLDDESLVIELIRPAIDFAAIMALPCASPAPVESALTQNR